MSWKNMDRCPERGLTRRAPECPPTIFQLWGSRRRNLLLLPHRHIRPWHSGKSLRHAFPRKVTLLPTAVTPRGSGVHSSRKPGLEPPWPEAVRFVLPPWWLLLPLLLTRILRIAIRHPRWWYHLSSLRYYTLLSLLIFHQLFMNLINTGRQTLNHGGHLQNISAPGFALVSRDFRLLHHY